MMERELAEFIGDSFRSVWAVEILLVLHEDPSRAWRPEQIIEELRSSEVVVRQGLGDLVSAGLIVLEADGSVRFGPASASQDRLTGLLAETYRIKPGAVRRLIVHGPADKLRTFSDAFRIIRD